MKKVERGIRPYRSGGESGKSKTLKCITSVLPRSLVNNLSSRLSVLVVHLHRITFLSCKTISLDQDFRVLYKLHNPKAGPTAKIANTYLRSTSVNKIVTS